jgi:hypothetical protein
VPDQVSVRTVGRVEQPIAGPLIPPGRLGTIADVLIGPAEVEVELCATGGTVIWTRHREPPDLVPHICRWFATQGFQLRWLSDPDAGFGVGVHRFAGHPRSPIPGARMFSFVGRKNDP